MLANADDGWRLSLSVPLFTDASERAEASIQAVAEWLDSYVFDDVPASGVPQHDIMHGS